MWLEIFLAIMGKVSTGAFVILFLGLVVAFVAAVFSPIIITELEITPKQVGAFLKRYVIFLLLAGLVAGVPSVEDLWKVRIGLIKLHLASPENIQKGADVIERIGAKLECKYLGCEPAKETK